MKPQDFRNGDEGGNGVSRSSEGSDSEGSEGSGEEDLSVQDLGMAARVLGALNALRKSRQHYDVVLVGGGGEVPAHGAVLAAASPYLLARLPTAGGAHPHQLRVEGVDPESLRALVEYAYTGSLRVRDCAAARRLYAAAWRLRLDALRSHLADRLVARLAPHDCVATRALPDLAPHHLQAVDAYIAAHFEEAASAGALATLPVARLDLLLEGGAARGAEPPLPVAEAALAWLSQQFDADTDLDVVRSARRWCGRDACGRWAGATRGTVWRAPSGWCVGVRRGRPALRCRRRAVRRARARGAAGWWRRAGRTARARCAALTGCCRAAATRTLPAGGARAPPCVARGLTSGSRLYATCCTPSPGSPARSSSLAWSAFTSRTASGLRSATPSASRPHPRPPRYRRTPRKMTRRGISESRSPPAPASTGPAATGLSTHSVLDAARCGVASPRGGRGASLSLNNLL